MDIVAMVSQHVDGVEGREVPMAGVGTFRLTLPEISNETCLSVFLPFVSIQELLHSLLGW